MCLFRRFGRCSAAAASMLLTVDSVIAQSISNTGAVLIGIVDSDVGRVDHIRCKLDPGASGSGSAVSAMRTGHSLFFRISATSTGFGGGGIYLFRIFFDLTGFDPSTAVLSFRSSVANTGGSLGFSRINRGAVGGNCSTFALGMTQTVSTGFVSGMNELNFVVLGDGQTDGLLVADATIVASNLTVVPEPASVALFEMGWSCSQPWHVTGRSNQATGST